jgi:hypothetical protein
MDPSRLTNIVLAFDGVLQLDPVVRLADLLPKHRFGKVRWEVREDERANSIRVDGFGRGRFVRHDPRDLWCSDFSDSSFLYTRLVKWSQWPSQHTQKLA